MAQPIFIGVDGGASKCVVRIEDAAGQLLGREISGPANIRLSVTQAWLSIDTALKKILHPLGITLSDKNYQFHAGMGLAGCEIKEAYHTFIHQPNKFETLIVSSDSHTACLGAHRGADGAVIIIGTGAVGYQIKASEVVKVSGWGFPHDDEGGGAWLGLQAVRATLHWLDKRSKKSGLANAIYTYFANDQDRLVNWANQANSTDFAELAPIVIQQGEAGDQAAIHIMQQSASAIDNIATALEKAEGDNLTLPCSLVGGISSYIQPFLSLKLRARLCPCQLPPDAGAILLARGILSHA